MAGLNIIGSTQPLRQAIWPKGFNGEVMLLLHETWCSFVMHQDVRLENNITALFRNALIKAYNDAGRIWFVALEDPILDLNYGWQTGRNDMNFYPTTNYGQTVFFTVECKRLNAQTESGFKHLADHYATKGVQRFVDSAYSAGLPCGGMVGYVMNDQVSDAFERVKEEISSRRSELKIATAEVWLIPSTVLPNCEFSADSIHNRVDGEFTLHHILVKTSRQLIPISRNRQRTGSSKDKLKGKKRKADDSVQ